MEEQENLPNKRDEQEEKGIWHSDLFTACLKSPCYGLMACTLPFCLWSHTASRVRCGPMLLVFLFYFIPFAIIVLCCYLVAARNNDITLGGHEISSYASIGIPAGIGAIILLATAYRIRMRSLYEIKGNPAMDLGTHCFCHFCAMVQEAREADRFEEKARTMVVKTEGW